MRRSGGAVTQSPQTVRKKPQKTASRQRTRQPPSEPSRPSGPKRQLGADFKRTLAPINVVPVCGFYSDLVKFQSRAGSAGSPQKQHLKPSASRTDRTSSYLLIVPLVFPAANAEPRPSPFFARWSRKEALSARRGGATWLSLG